MSVDNFLLSASATDLNYPEIRPSLDLNFARTKTLDPRITFTRSSGGSYVGADGLIKYAGVNEARFDHDPITGQSLGLLIEEGRINIALQSENISTSPWGTSTLTVSTNSIVAPDGNTTADKLIENPSFSTFKTITQSVGTISGTYTVSAFFKAGERFRGYLQLFGLGGNSAAIFDLKTGTITGGTGTNTITPYPNGWYRVSSSQTFTSDVAAIYIVVQNDSGVTSYTGDGNSGLYCWGPQLEVGAFPTSYIPTQASTVTRAADNAQITGTNFSSWYRQDEGTVFADSSRYALGGTNVQYIICEAGVNIFNNNNVIQMGTQFNANNMQFLVNTSGINQVSIVEPSIISKTKYICSYKINDFAYTKNGVNLLTDKIGTVPIVNQFNIGSRPAFGNVGHLNGTISRLTYYPKALSNSQLRALTR